MKIFNIIACIIVLLLAAVSAVFSYFLYEKRVQFIDGWSQMSDAIYQSAKTIDGRSNEKFASKLTADQLSHKEYSKDEFAKKLQNLTKQSESFVSQFDELTKNLENTKAALAKTQNELARVKDQRAKMAAVFAEIGNKVNAGTGNAAKFVDPSTSMSTCRTVRGKVFSVVDNREGIAKELAKIAKIDKNLLFTSPVRGLAPVNSLISSYRSARDNYAHSLNMIATMVKVKFNNNGQRATAVSDGVRRMTANVSSLQNQLGGSKRDVGNLKAAIGKRDAEIARLNGVILDYKRVLNINKADADPKVWKRGSLEARNALLGTVVEVSQEYGYIVINFGTDTTVSQTIGNRTHTVNADIEPGLSFNVTRDDKFIASVTLNNVGAVESTANIPVGKADQIKVGDKVLFKK